jgi:hypothetical protein
MTYESTLATYRKLLADHPDQALEIGDQCFAVLVDGHLFGVQQGVNGGLSIEEAFDFDVSAWSERGCWDADESGTQTANAIANPRYVMMLNPDTLTYDKLYAAYEALLVANPGKALKLPDGGALFLENNEIYAVTLDEDGKVEHDTAGIISSLSWDDEERRWESEDSAEQCVSAVNSPVFISL